MPPDPINLSRRAEPAELPEWMDEPCTYPDFRQCLIDLGQVNRLTLAFRPTLNFLNRIPRTATPLRIVDVGSGGGDLLRHTEHWAARRNITVQLTGIDLNPYAARVGREFTAPPSKIRWITGDALSYTEPIDIVLSSLFTHHLPTPEIIRFLTWSEAVAQRGWFINDLAREPLPFHLFGPLASVMRWHRFVRHDGPVSFRRAFRETDWARMLAAANITAARTQRWTPGRLCVERFK